MDSTENCLTPMDKLNAITEVSYNIKTEIKAFWEGVDVDKRKLVLDGEQIAMIYEYVVIKADI